jgi:hypothetical protein
MNTYFALNTQCPLQRLIRKCWLGVGPNAVWCYSVGFSFTMVHLIWNFMPPPPQRLYWNLTYYSSGTKWVPIWHKRKPTNAYEYIRVYCVINVIIYPPYDTSLGMATVATTCICRRFTTFVIQYILICSYAFVGFIVISNHLNAWSWIVLNRSPSSALLLPQQNVTTEWLPAFWWKGQKLK